jgi:hypothetical protein
VLPILRLRATVRARPGTHLAEVAGTGGDERVSEGMVHGSVHREALRRARLGRGGLAPSRGDFSGSLHSDEKTRRAGAICCSCCASSATYVGLVGERERGASSLIEWWRLPSDRNAYYSPEVQGPYEMFELGDFTLEEGPTLRGLEPSYMEQVDQHIGELLDSPT